MMELRRMNSNYAFIGNFVSLLLENEQRIKNMLLDYKVQVFPEKLKDGREIHQLVFNKDHIQIRFLVNRVDFNFIFFQPQKTKEESLKEALNFFGLFGEIFPDERANRIALASTFFMENQNLSGVQQLAETFGMSSVFGSCSELNLHYNTIRNYFEPINSVIEIRPGDARNQEKNISMPVLIFNFDINTLASNQEARFFAGNLQSAFSDFLLEEAERIEEFKKL